MSESDEASIKVKGGDILLYQHAPHNHVRYCIVHGHTCPLPPRAPHTRTVSHDFSLVSNHGDSVVLSFAHQPSILCDLADRITLIYVGGTPLSMQNNEFSTGTLTAQTNEPKYNLKGTCSKVYNLCITFHSMKMIISQDFLSTILSRIKCDFKEFKGV